MLRALPLLVLGLAGALPASAGIHGRYVEARTASVFAGACHFGGEVVTRGKDALLAFRVDSGKQDGVDLAGITALAVVTSSENLRGPERSRRSLLVVDGGATNAQAAALVRALEASQGNALGEIVAIRRASVRFAEAGSAIEAAAAGYGVLSVAPLPDRACCKMPHLVWYEPLIPLSDTRVGYTLRAESTGGGIFPSWMDAGENTAFYGSF